MEMKARNIYIYRQLPLLTIILIGVAYLVCSFFIPPLGDDLGFICSFELQNDCWYAFPRSMYRHWLFNNGRMADMLTPIGLNYMPIWLRSLSNAVVTSGLFYLIVRLSGFKNRASVLWRMIIIAAVVFVMRWDGIWMEYVATYNYVWGASFSLFAIMLILKDKSDRACWWLAVPFCFIAASMHEASGFPLAVGLAVYCMLTSVFKNNSLPGKLMIAAFIFGGIFPMTSVGAYRRVGSMLQPENPLAILLGSDAFLCVLIVAVIILFLYRREILKRLCRSSWIIFMIASVVSAGFMFLSQFGGRPGWFAQIFAIIAVFGIIAKTYLRIKDFKCVKIVSFGLFGIVVLHYLAVTVWQIRLGSEARNVIELYRESPSGIVYMDYHNEPVLPWYLLRKTHGVPDDDDTYYRSQMRKFYGGGKQMVILPTGFRGSLDSLSGEKECGDFVLSSAPLNGAYGDTIVAIFPRVFVDIDGIPYVQNEFEYDGNTLYLYSKVDPDRGEK